MFAAISQFSMVGEATAEAISAALRRRDAEQVGRLVEQYHYRLLRYLVYVTGRREAAEDLVQETWIRALERAGQYDGRSRFEPWLFSIARNLAIDQMRREGREAVSRDEDAPEPTAAEPSPFAAAARSEDAIRLAAALGGLAPAQREALLLRFQEELSLDEIAAVTGSPVSTVSSRIQRGLAALRATFEGGAHA